MPRKSPTETSVAAVASFARCEAEEGGVTSRNCYKVENTTCDVPARADRYFLKGGPANTRLGLIRDPLGRRASRLPARLGDGRPGWGCVPRRPPGDPSAQPSALRAWHPSLLMVFTKQTLCWRVCGLRAANNSKGHRDQELTDVYSAGFTLH